MLTCEEKQECCPVAECRLDLRETGQKEQQDRINGAQWMEAAHSRGRGGGQEAPFLFSSLNGHGRREGEPLSGAATAPAGINGHPVEYDHNQ